MNLHYHSAVIFVKDIAISRHFYQEILNQEIEYDFGTNIMLKGGLSLWQINGDHIIAQKLLSSKGSKTHEMELYFETDDIDKIVLNIKSLDLNLLHDTREESWGQKTIRFFDPDQNLIEVGETLYTFIARLCNEMSIDDVSKKTGVSVTDIRKITAK